MTDFKVTKSGWYRTMDGSFAEVVVTPANESYPVVGYIVGINSRFSWTKSGAVNLSFPLQKKDLVEYLGKERPKEPKKYKTTVFLYDDGRATLDGILCESHPLRSSPQVVKTREIEWEVPDNG